jgi:hypothetical protein
MPPRKIIGFLGDHIRVQGDPDGPQAITIPEMDMFVEEDGRVTAFAKDDGNHPDNREATKDGR